jgi:hypothetical protein
MNHDTLIRTIYEDEDLTFFTRLGIALHLLGCGKCAREVVRYEQARDIMRTEFFGDAPIGVAEAVMARIVGNEAVQLRGYAADLPPEVVSIRNWIASGVILIAALVTSFFGLDFGALTKETGIGFPIPLAIVIGVAITAYIAMFIVNHLQELTKKFGLHDQFQTETGSFGSL